MPLCSGRFGKWRKSFTLNGMLRFRRRVLLCNKMLLFFVPIAFNTMQIHNVMLSTILRHCAVPPSTSIHLSLCKSSSAWFARKNERNRKIEHETHFLDVIFVRAFFASLSLLCSSAFDLDHFVSEISSHNRLCQTIGSMKQNGFLYFFVCVFPLRRYCVSERKACRKNGRRKQFSYLF